MVERTRYEGVADAERVNRFDRVLLVLYGHQVLVLLYAHDQTCSDLIAQITEGGGRVTGG